MMPTKRNRNIEKQEQIADEMYQKVYGKTEEAAPVESNEGEESPSVQAESEAPATEDAPVEEAQAEAAENVQEVKAEEKAPEPRKDDWEHKYKVLQNKYSAEVPRYAAEIRELKAEIKSLKEESAKPAATPDAFSSLTPEEIEEYGEKFVDFVKRAARDGVPQTDNNVNELKESVDQMRKEQDQIALRRFIDELNGLAPQWRDLNEDEGFLDFLQGFDPYSGQPRQTLFDRAYDERDAYRIAHFFNDYHGQQEQQPQEPKPSLEPQVTPKVTGKSAPQKGKKVYSTAEVARFYDDMRRGKYSSDEAARIEQDIFAAQAEGRFR
jgi:hypothetical protein